MESKALKTAGPVRFETLGAAHGILRGSASNNNHEKQVRDLNMERIVFLERNTFDVAALAGSIGMQVLVAERKHATNTREGRTEFGEVLRLSDVLTLHCPLTEETRNLIDAAEFQMMKREAILINTARGGLVREEALVEALHAGVIAGAAFDVLSEEPPRQGNILLDQDLPNLIVTPHVAWASKEAMQTLADQLIDNIEAFIRGEPRNLVV